MMRPYDHRRRFLFILFVLLLASLIGCSGDGEEASAPQQQNVALTVRAGTPVATGPNATIPGATNYVTSVDTRLTSLGELVTAVSNKVPDLGNDEGLLYTVDGQWHPDPPGTHVLSAGDHTIRWYWKPNGRSGEAVIPNDAPFLTVRVRVAAP